MDKQAAEFALSAAAAKRLSTEAAFDEAAAAERAAIVDAWRAGVPPTRIAALAHRTATHVRTLRPDDVPPARLGGGAAPKRRKRKLPVDTRPMPTVDKYDALLKRKPE